jgi:exoribonuclease II
MKKSNLPKEAYDQFYGTYLSVLDDSELKVLLVNDKTGFTKFIENIPEEKLHTSYELGKWTIAEVILHIIDAERVFQYRALRFLRND